MRSHSWGFVFFVFSWAGLCKATFPFFQLHGKREGSSVFFFPSAFFFFSIAGYSYGACFSFSFFFSFHQGSIWLSYLILKIWGSFLLPIFLFSFISYLLVWPLLMGTGGMAFFFLPFTFAFVINFGLFIHYLIITLLVLYFIFLLKSSFLLFFLGLSHSPFTVMGRVTSIVHFSSFFPSHFLWLRSESR
ncbi:hypothetical protein B9Z19DRAFT_198522 [Tuber borchii]|uniref:Uncharacterized protein n=1 Tax=Tuber borchii TaxID=42251 RepID=A0A2T6ZNI0_TUBBO|nr:hypothetical protein B9Z19DRAFT_198522 [Tuber borchii]